MLEEEFKIQSPVKYSFTLLFLKGTTEKGKDIANFQVKYMSIINFT